MTWTSVIWDDSEGGNVEHIAEHGLTIDDVEHVLTTFDGIDLSHTSGSTIVFGWIGNKRIAVVVEEIDDETIFPVTAYEVTL